MPPKDRPNRTKVLPSLDLGYGAVPIDAAFAALTKTEFAVWLRLSCEPAGALRGKTGHIYKAMGLKKSRAAEVLHGLEERGFIVVRVRTTGHADVVVKRRPYVPRKSGYVR